MKIKPTTIIFLLIVLVFIPAFVGSIAHGIGFKEGKDSLKIKIQFLCQQVHPESAKEYQDCLDRW